MKAKRVSKIASGPAEVPAKFKVCRGFLHEFRFINDSATRGLSGDIVEFTRESVCQVCMTRRFVTYSLPDWRVKKRKYDYPPKYRVKGGYSVYEARSDYINLRFNQKVS